MDYYKNKKNLFKSLAILEKYIQPCIEVTLGKDEIGVIVSTLEAIGISGEDLWELVTYGWSYDRYNQSDCISYIVS